MRVRLILGVIAALVLGAQAGGAATLRIGMMSDPDTLDPAESGSFISLQITGAMCDKLIDIDPGTSTSWADVLVLASEGVRPTPGLLVTALAEGVVPVASRLAL